MLLVIIMFYNVVLGYLLNDFGRKYKSRVKIHEYVVFGRVIQGMLVFLFLICTVFKVLYLIQEDYNYVMCLELISVITVNSLNNTIKTASPAG